MSDIDALLTEAEEAKGSAYIRGLLDRLAAALRSVQVPVTEAGERPTSEGGVWGSYVDYVKRLETFALRSFQESTIYEAVIDQAECDMLDRLIDRYFQGEKNRHNLGDSTISWLRAQPEYARRYPQPLPSPGTTTEESQP